MMIRREGSTDEVRVREIHVAAFGRGEEPMEARLLDALRTCGAWCPELSWVVERDGLVIGHVVCTRGAVDGVPALGLGPIAVDPLAQGRGSGSSLMHAVIGAADALGEPLLALLGSPEYYRRFGFVRSSLLGIAPPDPAWGEHFQVRTLHSYRPEIEGTFVYAEPFVTVS